MALAAPNKIRRSLELKLLTLVSVSLTTLCVPNKISDTPAPTASKGLAAGL